MSGSLLEQALDLHRAGQVGQAEALYRFLLEAQPGNADAWRLLGALCLGENRLEEAAQNLEESLRLRPFFATHDNLGTLCARQDRLPEAIAHFQQALRLEPNSIETRFNLGVALSKSGRLEEAGAHLQDLVKLQPRHPGAWEMLGNVFFKRQEWPQAESAYRQAVTLQPGLLAAMLKLARVLMKQLKQAEAAQWYERVLLLKPNDFEALVNLGSLEVELKQYKRAAQRLRKAVELYPEKCEAWVNLGSALLRTGQLPEAEATLRKALCLRPDFAEAWLNLGIALQEQGRYEEAAESFARACAGGADQPLAWSNSGLALAKMGRWGEAADRHARALELDPREAWVHLNWAVTLKIQGRFTEAEAALTTALKLDPDHAEAHQHRADLWLMQGDWRRGFEEYEWRWHGDKRLLPPPFPQPLWDGSPLQGRTLLVHAEQGLGDTLQFIRLVLNLRQRGEKVLFQCRPALTTLCQSLFPPQALLAEGIAPPAFDVHLALLSLARVLGLTERDLPGEVPYLIADDRLREKWADKVRPFPGLKVGLAWQGNAKYPNDRLRSIPLREFVPLRGIPDLHWFSLQKGPGSEQLAELATGWPIHDWTASMDNETGAFMDTAALIQNLDLVITSDTAIAHLAGGLGKPVWLALPYYPDWRWLWGREDSPWYPTMRLFRQKAWGDWGEVFQGMAREVAANRPCPGW